MTAPAPLRPFARVWVAISRHDRRPYVLVDLFGRMAKLGPFESRALAEVARTECLAEIRDVLVSRGFTAETILESKGGTA